MLARLGAHGAIEAIVAIGCTLMIAGGVHAAEFGAIEFVTGGVEIDALTAANQMPAPTGQQAVQPFNTRAYEFSIAEFTSGRSAFPSLAAASYIAIAVESAATNLFDARSRQSGAIRAATDGVKTAAVSPAKQMPSVIEPQTTEPFEVDASVLIEGGIQRKWRSVEKNLPHEHDILARCRANAAACTPAASKFLAIIDRAVGRDGWTRIAEINRAINLNVRPAADMAQYGVIDLWATPLMTFASSAGDCEDYAIAKYVALKESGVLAGDLRLVVVHDRAANEVHAVAAVRNDGEWLILDNRTLDMRRDADIGNFEPLFLIDEAGVKRATVNHMRPQFARAHVALTATSASPEADHNGLGGEQAIPVAMR